MRSSRVTLIFLIIVTLLNGQGIPTDQIVHPSADVLPAYHINVQGGYVNLVGQEGWRRAIRIGIANVAEFEWTRLGFYTDLTGTSQTIPTAGIKLRIPTPFRFLGMAIALYNAQQWEYHPSSKWEYGVANAAYDANYGWMDEMGQVLQRVNFESIYSRLDILANIKVTRNFHLHPAVFYLESKSRNLDVVWVEEDSLTIDDYFDSRYSDTSVKKNQLPGFGLGLTYTLDDHLTYMAQWVIHPQYHFDFDTKRLTLDQRHVWVAGVRYKILAPVMFDVGIFNDEMEGTLADVQVYAMLNVVVDIAHLKDWLFSVPKRVRKSDEAPPVPE